MARRVVQVFALSRILDQLTRPIANSKGLTDWQKYPKNRQSIRKQQPEPLENKTCHAFPGNGVRLQSALPLNFGQLFNLLFSAKGFNSTQSVPDGPGLRFGNDTHAHCLNTGQLSSRCLFLNRVAVHCYVAASEQCFKAKLGYHKIQVAARRPGDGMAGATVAQGRRPRPGGITGRFSIFFFAERFNSQLSHSNPSQTARAYGSGVTLTRAHRDSDCLNLNTGQLELSSCCLFLNRLAVRRHIAGSNLCFPARLPPNPSGGPARRRHGWSGWWRRACAGRSTPATR